MEQQQQQVYMNMDNFRLIQTDGQQQQAQQQFQHQGIIMQNHEGQELTVQEDQQQQQQQQQIIFSSAMTQASPQQQVYYANISPQNQNRLQQQTISINPNMLQQQPKVSCNCVIKLASSSPTSFNL